jgi:hypothetical protein
VSVTKDCTWGVYIEGDGLPVAIFANAGLASWFAANAPGMVWPLHVRRLAQAGKGE